MSRNKSTVCILILTEEIPYMCGQSETIMSRNIITVCILRFDEKVSRILLIRVIPGTGSGRGSIGPRVRSDPQHAMLTVLTVRK